MKLNDFLVEVELGVSPELNKLFDMAMKQIFSVDYYNKINKKIKKRIRVKEIDYKDPNAIAYTKGTTIYINREPFNKLSKDEQIRYLLHEFVHIMQRSKSFFIFAAFRELKNLERTLYSIVKRNIVKPISMFLTGKNINIGQHDEKEIIAYLLRGSISWKAMTPKGKKLFVDELRNSRLFNLTSRSWQQRLQ